VVPWPFLSAIGLSVIYVGLPLALGGVHPRNGFPWWFFAPAMVSMAAYFIAEKVTAVLPLSWEESRNYGPPPRPVGLSWRSALRLPAALPIFLIPWHFLWILNYHFHAGWLNVAAAALAAGVLAFILAKRRREFHLLRDGEMAMGVIDSRTNVGEGPERIAFHFVTANGVMISRRGWDAGHNLEKGSRVPVFYDAADPGRCVAACACWFEAETRL